MAEQKKLDRRVVRTRQLLRDALTELILEKGFDAVTVSDIAERANLGRATFYLHYRDKEELLFKSLEAVFDELVEKIEPLGSNFATSPPMVAFQHAAENSDLYLIILSGQGSGSIYKRVREYMARIALERFLTDIVTDTTLPRDLLANYVSGSLLSLIDWWLRNGMPESAETMALNFHSLMMLGLAQHLQIDPRRFNFEAENRLQLET